MDATLQSRRALLRHSASVAAMLATLGLLPDAAQAQAGEARRAFDAKSIDELMRTLGGAKPTASSDVSLQAPDLAENGAMVAVGVSTRLPGVRRLLLLVEKNPTLVAAMFDLSDAVEPNISTRIKMAQSSNVYGVAMMQDGRVLFAQKDVKVTLGGCG
jgi:sulfur-oxidizing protein SoxY